MIIANVWNMLRDPEVYQDPASFNPSRFMGPLEEPNPEDVVFGFGRRRVHPYMLVCFLLITASTAKCSRCPGIAVAQSSVWLSVALTLAAYNVTPTLGDDGKPKLPPLKYSYTTVR